MRWSHTQAASDGLWTVLGEHERVDELEVHVTAGGCTSNNLNPLLSGFIFRVFRMALLRECFPASSSLCGLKHLCQDLWLFRHA